MGSLLDGDSQEEFLWQDDNPYPRHTRASYQVARFGLASLSLIEAAIEQDLVSRYDIFSFLNVNPDIIEEVFASYRPKVAEVDGYGRTTVS